MTKIFSQTSRNTKLCVFSDNNNGCLVSTSSHEPEDENESYGVLELPYKSEINNRRISTIIFGTTIAEARDAT